MRPGVFVGRGLPAADDLERRDVFLVDIATDDLHAEHDRGRVKAKVAPSPRVLSTQMAPPWSSMIVFDTKRPTPDPEVCFTVVSKRLKRGEQAIHVVALDPGAVIHHSDEYVILLGLNRQVDRGPLGGELRGVRQKIQEHLLHAVAIGPHVAVAPGYLERGPRRLAGVDHRLGDELGKIDLVGTQLDLAALDGLEIEEFRNQPREKMRVPVEGVEQFVSRLGREPVVLPLEDVSYPRHHCHRRAQLVGDHRQEVATHLVDLSQLFSGVHRRVIEPCVV